MAILGVRTWDSRSSFLPSRRLSSGCDRKCRQAARRFVAWGILALLIAAPVWPQKKDTDLAEKSLEDLMNTKVTSVSKKEQKLSRVAAAIFVITQEDIRRSGATNIPDLLRMVPGLDVGQINGSTWAISSRGFNTQFSNKLLVMIDGRIVYTPNFAGVYWDTLDLPLEDIQRIEVIRGPGGTVWGANAVNGVISIFTKKAGETSGGMIAAGGGNLDQGFGTAQYGGRLGKGTDYRFYTKYLNQNHMPDLTGQNGADTWHMLRGGFRMDSKPSSNDALTVEGDLYSAREGELGFFLPSVTSPALVPIREQITLGGGFLQSAWSHFYSARSDSTLQISFNRMSHEIRTPMNGILGMTELALDTPLNKEQREYLGMVKSSADSLLAMMNDILDFSKIEGGKLELEPVEFSLRETVGDTLKILTLRAHQKRLKLCFLAGSGVPELVVGDPGRLRQVIVNLVGNAIKFTQKGEVVVEVERAKESGDGVDLLFSVRDTGIGIPKEKQGLIFNAFTQADSSMTRRYAGSGLGLAITKRLVEKMGGKIWLESEPGQGSTFYFGARFGFPSRETEHPSAVESAGNRAVI